MAGMQRRSRVPEREKPHSRFRIRWPYVFLVVILGLFTYQFVQRMQEVRRLQAQASALQYENNQTAQENKQLQSAIRYYRTSQYIEDQARGLLGDTYPGEVSIVSRPVYQRHAVVRKAPPTPIPTPSPSWQEWWQAFAH